MDACTAESEIGEKKMAVRATAETDEALAAARTLVHGVRHSVSADALGRVRAEVGTTRAGMSSAVAALFARRRAVARAGGVQQFGALDVGALADRSVTHGVLRWKGGLVFDKSSKQAQASAPRTGDQAPTASQRCSRVEARGLEHWVSDEPEPNALAAISRVGKVLP